MANDKKKVLVVEDEKVVSDALRQKFDLEGFETTVAPNGTYALEYLKNEKFDLILLDLVMPVMDGFKFLAELEINQQLNDAPIVILSNLQRESNEVKALPDEYRAHYMVKTDTKLTEIIENVKKQLN